MLKLVNGRPPTLNSRYEIVGVIDVVGGVWHYLAWDEADDEPHAAVTRCYASRRELEAERREDAARCQWSSSQYG